MSAGESTTVPVAVPEAPSGRAIARLSALNLAARVASGAAALATAVITTNVLDTAGRGIYAILTTWVGIIATMATGGTPVLAADLIYGRHSVAALQGASLAIAGALAVLLLPVSLFVSGLGGGAALGGVLFAGAGTAVGANSGLGMWVRP